MKFNPNAHPIQTAEPAAREKFLRDAGITMTWELLGGDPAKGEEVRYRFTLRRRGGEGEPVLVWREFAYRCGCGHYTEFNRKPPYKVTKPLVPEVESFLECLRSDCTAIRHNETFESFVDEMGMNGDAKEAVKVWEAIKTTWADLQTLLSKERAEKFVDMEIEDEWQ